MKINPAETKKALRLQVSHCANLLTAMENELSFHRTNYDATTVAALGRLNEQIDSERAVNEQLTEEIEQCQKNESILRGIIFELELLTQ